MNYRLLASILLFTQFLSAQEEASQLIIRGDDMGFSHSGNLALIDSYKNGVVTAIEVLAPAPWFPEAVKMLNENPNVDVGIHLALSSEWDLVKWRPLTAGKSFTDVNGYFLPQIFKHAAYPGLSLSESNWKIDEVEEELRAQIELVLRNLPQTTHLSIHMGFTRVDEDLNNLVYALAQEYNLIYSGNLALEGANYIGETKTQSERLASFTAMLDSMKPGRNYMFLEHPAMDSPELQSIYHTNYEDVSFHRQAVYEFLTNDAVSEEIAKRGIKRIGYKDLKGQLPRSTGIRENFEMQAFDNYLNAVEKSGQELHSVLVMRNGRVIAEKWLGEHNPKENHIMHSVSKSFTSTAIGFAIQEGRINVTDPVLKFFPDLLNAEERKNLKDLTIEHLLTMSPGHAEGATSNIRSTETNWELAYLKTPLVYKPGSRFQYDSLNTYILAAILEKETGLSLVEYLKTRLFDPLYIETPQWDKSPTGITNGGWGLYIKTEDMAKLGQFYLNKGKWNTKQLLNTAWFESATTKKIQQAPSWVDASVVKEADSDWLQGYAYQFWRSRHNSYRADGMDGQFILILPELNAVIVTTAKIENMQAEINLIWEHILPGFKN